MGFAMKNNSFDSFVMSQTIVNQIDSLPEELQLKFYRAVSNYGLHGIDPDFSGLEYTVWVSMRDFIIYTKRRNEEWHEKQREHGKKGASKRWQPHIENGDPINPIGYDGDPICENSEMATPFQKNVDGHNGNGNGNGNEFVVDFPETTESEDFPTAYAVDHQDLFPEKSLVPVKSSPPVKKQAKNELTPGQLDLYNAGKLCFESSEKSKAIIYQDRTSTAMHLKCLKDIVYRCCNVSPGIEADFLRNVLEHFKTMCNGKLKGKAVFTPRCLITPWIWELVIDSLPENNITPELQAEIKGIFK